MKSVAEQSVGELETARLSSLGAARTLWLSAAGIGSQETTDAMIDCSSPPSLPPGQAHNHSPTSVGAAKVCDEDIDDLVVRGQLASLRAAVMRLIAGAPTTRWDGEPTERLPHNVSDTHDTVPSGHFFAGQTATGVVLLCEMAVVDDGKHCTWVDFGSSERIVLMQALHASRCEHYFHWNASLARPRIVGRHGTPVRLKALLLVAETRRGVELFAKLEGLEQRLLGLVAESKELAVQELVAWIRCSDEESVVPLPPHTSSGSSPGPGV